ncbi:MAG: hypothetical protein ABH873_03270 [Candidatus Firestonebacteria bacterium]
MCASHRKGIEKTRGMREGRKKTYAQNIIIKYGKGRYPKCFEILPYDWCSKKEEIPDDPKNVPKECR